MKKLLMKLENYQVLSTDEQTKVNGGVCFGVYCKFLNGSIGVVPTFTGATSCAAPVITVCAGYFNVSVNTLKEAGNNCGQTTCCQQCGH